jgi:hypothetical protein
LVSPSAYATVLGATLILSICILTPPAPNYLGQQGVTLLSYGHS